MADYLKIPELARRLDVSEKTARRYIKTGMLPSTFIGNSYRVTEEDLEAFIHSAEVRPEGSSPGKASAPQPGQGKPAPVTTEVKRLEASAELLPVEAVTVDRGQLVAVLRERAGMSADEAEEQISALEVA